MHEIKMEESFFTCSDKFFERIGRYDGWRYRKHIISVNDLYVAKCVTYAAGWTAYVDAKDGRVKDALWKVDYKKDSGMCCVYRYEAKSSLMTSAESAEQFEYKGR